MAIRGLSALRPGPRGHRIFFAMEAPKECDYYEPASVRPTEGRIAVSPIFAGHIDR
jgi:hypothetical protein